MPKKQKSIKRWQPLPGRLLLHLLTYTRSSRCLCRDKHTNYLSVPRSKAGCPGYPRARDEVVWYQPLPNCPGSPRAMWGAGWKATQHHSAPEMQLCTPGHRWGPLPITARHAIQLPIGCGAGGIPGFCVLLLFSAPKQWWDTNRPLPRLVQVLLAAWHRAPLILCCYPWIFAAPEARRSPTAPIPWGQQHPGLAQPLSCSSRRFPLLLFLKKSLQRD